MADFIPYSEQQQILPTDVWENLRVLDQNCTTSKVAAETIRAIVSRLLRIDKTGKDVDINDFEFLVYDDDHPNAGFISSHNTKNNKNIVMVSTGITGLCKNEAELAGVLAHELGHFTYSKIYGDNTNTIFQERFSDLHALDLMIAGGYNPAAYSEVCEVMRESGGSSFFDVHGSSMARKEDVDAYLTKMHKEHGDFKVSAPTGLMKNFVDVVKSKKDTYKSYFRQLLEANFPEFIVNVPDSFPPINLVFDLVLSEIKKGKLNNSQRMSDMLNFIRRYTSAEKPEIQSTQNFLEQLVNLYITDKTTHKLLYRHEIRRLGSFLKSRFRNNKPFKIFHPADEYLEKIKEFMTTRDRERVKTLATDLHNADDIIFNIDDMKEIFSKPSGFKMPPRTLAKGHLMPTNWLMSVASESGSPFNLYIPNLIYRIGFDCRYKWITDTRWGNNNVGKILATNKEDIKKIQDKRWRQEEYEQSYVAFQDFMYAINTLQDFDKGVITAQEVSERLAQYGNQSSRKVKYDITSIIFWLKKNVVLSDYKHENPFLKLELKELNNSDAFIEMYIKPFLSMLKTVLNEVSPNLAKNIQLDNPPQGKTWLEYLQDVSFKYLDLKEEVEINLSNRIHLNGKLFDSLQHFARKLGVQDKDNIKWNVMIGPLLTHISGIYVEKLHSVLMKYINIAVKEDVYSARQAADILHVKLQNGDRSGNWHDFSENEMIELIGNLERQNKSKLVEDVIENYSVYATKDQWAAHNYILILEALDDEVKKKNDLHKIHRLLTAYGMIANNEQELLDILSRSTPTLRQDQLYELETKLKEYSLIYYMRKKQPIKNLYSILFATRADKVVKFSNDFADELAEYIEKNNLMPTDFQSIYDLYALMQKLNLFSKEKSNESKIIDSLINKIIKLPRPIREEYSWKLLSGFFYSDDDDRSILNRESKDIGLPLAKNKLMDIYSDAVSERLGLDNNTYEYFVKIQEISEFINQKHYYIRPYAKRMGINKVTQGKLYRLISDKIQSQEHVSQFLANDKNVVLTDADAQSEDLLGRGIESLLDQLDRYDELCVFSIEFLNRKLTAQSIADYRKKCANYSGYIEIDKFIKPSVLETFYNTFWSSSLEVRALIMNKLLNRAFDTLDEKIKYVCDMNFDKNDKYRAEAEMVCDCVIKSFKPYEQNLILAAIASADENKQKGKKSSHSVGDGLRMFFENMGPAWVKFGQLLSYVPDLPSEIRHDLGKLKDRADMPARWDVFTWMREALPASLYNRIERVDNIVGAGSFWMTAIVQLKNDKGIPEKKVIQLLRPYARERADAGFNTIEAAVNKLSKQDSSYNVLHNVASQAHKSAQYEVDVEVGNKQYIKAKELYGDIRVNIGGTDYTPHVADWQYYGVGKDAMAYKIMDYANGATLSRVDVSDEERRKMALAYFTIEMTILFKGDVWDIDRHQGQQNFDVVSPTKVDINIYDTGAQLPEAPDNKNKVLLANVFFELAQAIQAGSSIDAYLLKTIKRLNRLQNILNIDVSYVSNVEKGLMALSDIIEYQKEIKDKDGNIIQERKTLSSDDLKHAIIAVLQNPSVDRYLSAVIKGRLLISKVKHLEIKALKDLIEDSTIGQDNPVEINITEDQQGEHTNLFNVRKLNKADKEIEILNSAKDQILGIPKKHIEQQDSKIPLGFSELQKAI